MQFNVPRLPDQRLLPQAQFHRELLHHLLLVPLPEKVDPRTHKFGLFYEKYNKHISKVASESYSTKLSYNLTI